jgi:hypothetical protein
VSHGLFASDLHRHAETRYFVLESPLATVHSGCASGAKEIGSIINPRSISRKKYNTRSIGTL